MQSWVESANAPGCDFPLANLPYGRFQRDGLPRFGVAIGDQVLDLTACARYNLLPEPPPTIFGLAGWRESIQALLTYPGPARTADLLAPMREVQMLLPADIGDYTDFYAGIHHAQRCGRLFRPDNPLAPNYKYLPVAYHGRASSVVVSGSPVLRPSGQRLKGDTPEYGLTEALDYELELGIWIGEGNALGEPIPISRAARHIFGVCMLNDWSARDIQTWEAQPLGPFLAKSFCTSISPWIVTMEALAPYRCPAFARLESDPPPLPHLYDPGDQRNGGIDLTMEVWLNRVMVSRANFRDVYWTIAQMVAHHTSNGCNLRPGDLLGSGTVSGEQDKGAGCLLELTSRGRNPVTLANGQRRAFLEDGDEVALRGYAERPGLPRIGLGECTGRISYS